MSYFRIQKSFLKRPHQSLFYRLKSSSSGRSSARLAVYGLTLTSASVLGGTVAYANYDDQFKLKIDSYLPGFGTFSERSAVLWNKGMGLAGEGWKNIKKVVLPEKSERVGIQVRTTSKVETTPIVPLETTPTESINTEVVTTPTEAIPTEASTTEPKTVLTSDFTETTPTNTEAAPILVETTPTDNVPVEAIPILTETTLTDSLPKEDLRTNTIDTITPETTPSDATPTETPSEAILSPIETTPTETTIITENTQQKTTPSHDTPSFNVLEDTFKEFTDSSDAVIKSMNDLVDALNIHLLQINEATKSPPKDEKEIDLIVGSIIGTEEAVDSARKQVEKTREKQQDVSQQLANAITAAREEGANEGVIEQICDKIGNYTQAFEEGERKVMEAERNSQTQIKKLQNADVSSFVGNQDRTLLMARIALLEKEIETTKKEEERKIAEAIVNQQVQHDHVLEEKIASAIKEKEEEFKEKLENLEVELELEYEGKIKEQLYSQAKAHIAHAKNALNEQAERLTQELEQKHSEQEKELAENYQLKLATALAHLKGIHSVIDTVVEASDSTRRQQSVRVASDALTNVLITANNNPDPFTRHSIGNQVETLSKVASNDEFITTMLSGIPREALVRGISSENGLKTRFERVKHIASRVALVPEEGGGLGTYLLSFLQSLLTIDMIHSRTIELSKTDPSSLSTFDLLHQAKLSLDHGDLEKAIKCVAQLKGESRRVAQDWLTEALMYLETRQAVMAITQYLAASNAAVLQ